MFQSSFKYYKSKCPPPEYTEVIDFCCENVCGQKAVKLILDSKPFDFHPPCFGLEDAKSWKIYEITQRPGLVFIKNPFTSIGQRYWIAKSLLEYSKCRNNLLPSQFSTDVIDNWWTCLQATDKPPDKLKSALRWATIGYHYDWDSKIYNESLKSEFPVDLGYVCQSISSVLGHQLFKPQAAIVNYYPIGTTLAGHTDHSEVDLDAPLFSFSFGQSAIFLIGGETKEEKPSAILLRSGDIVVMSKASRLCYHAVPRVFAETKNIANGCLEVNERILPTAADDKFDDVMIKYVQDNQLWKPCEEYIASSRININVRQVLKPGQDSLDS